MAARTDAVRPMKVAPNWFTAAMGTGIVANAAVLLPRDAAWLRGLALAAWLAAALLLLRLAAVAFEQWRRARRVRDCAGRRVRGAGAAGAGRAGGDLAMAPFWGAPPMAAMTVGAGALLVGGDLMGQQAALAVASTLWALGTLGGLAASVTVPLWMLRHPERRLDAVFATWLLPVVPPLVSATTGAALIAHLPAGHPRLLLLLGCWAMFGASLLAVAATIALVWRRLAAHGCGPARMVPTLFIVLGPLGQSITAACLLAAAAPAATGAAWAGSAGALALVYGLPVLGFALAWLAVALTITWRTARRGLPFAPTWWSFIFPIGTCVTGASELAVRTGAAPLDWLAIALFALLLTAWLLVTGATARHALLRGRRAAVAA